MAVHLPDFTPAPPIQSQTDARFAEHPKAPYAMNYTDEAAQSLGVVNGRADFLDIGPSNSSYMPSLKGGVDHNGAMLRLQWHPGE